MHDFSHLSHIEFNTLIQEARDFYASGTTPENSLLRQEALKMGFLRDDVV